ncbi:MAG: hypothetical protein H0V39_04880 [Nitrosomonas sp.]|nr:hypothetical protein [Nitrosomonas sp.]
MNSDGKVLATTGDEKTISIDNLSSINREIRKSKSRYQFYLKEPENSAEEIDKQHLPSYSSHVDIKLSYGEFRIFIFLNFRNIYPIFLIISHWNNDVFCAYPMN